MPWIRTLGTQGKNWETANAKRERWQRYLFIYLVNLQPTSPNKKYWPKAAHKVHKNNIKPYTISNLKNNTEKLIKLDLNLWHF